MPNYTENYNLIKPKKEENYDVNETTNNNMDIIDNELYKRVQKIPGKGLSSNDFTNEYIKKINQMGEAKRGFTFTPSVSEEGIISWENDGELENPAPVNIKGPQGEIGPQGIQGIQGPQGPQGEKGEIGNGIESITIFDKLQYGNVYSINFTDGTQKLIEIKDGATYIPTVDSDGNLSFENTQKLPNPPTVNIMGPQGPQGEQGIQGPQGERGDKGDTGPANQLSIGSVISGNIASATITGDAPNQVLNLVLPKGDTGEQGPAGVVDTSNFYTKNETDNKLSEVKTRVGTLEESLENIYNKTQIDEMLVEYADHLSRLDINILDINDKDTNQDTRLTNLENAIGNVETLLASI